MNIKTSDGKERTRNTVRSFHHEGKFSIMEKAFEFLSCHKDVAFATVEQDRPKIRVFQIMKQEGHTLYFATARHKEVYRQLMENPTSNCLPWRPF